MIRALCLLCVGSIAACSADSNPADDSLAPECNSIVDSTVPENGATDVYERTDIAFHLTDPDGTAVITTTIPGHQELSADSHTVEWVLDGPMEWSTEYSLVLDYCGGSAELAFTTAPGEGPTNDPVSLIGRTYAVTLADARIVEPAGIGSVLTSYLTTDILLGVTGVGETSIDLLGGVSRSDVTPDEQDQCSSTFLFPTADFSSQPYFSAGPQSTTLSIAGYDVEIMDMTITGTFAAEGTYFDGGTLSGTLDTRPLAPLIDDSGDPNAICELAINFGAECVACPSDAEPYCLNLVMDQILAQEVEGVTLVAVGADNCVDCANPSDTTDLSETCEVDPNL